MSSPEWVWCSEMVRVSPSAVALWTDRALVAINNNDARPTRTLVRDSHSTLKLRRKPPATQNPVRRQLILRQLILVVPRYPTQRERMNAVLSQEG